MDVDTYQPESPSPMPTPITAPDDRGLKVTVYEPRQKPNQEEVVIEEFELEAGETRELELRSATAAYRQEPMGARSVPLDPNFVPPAQEAPKAQGLAPTTTAELNLGKERAAANKSQQENVPKAKQDEEKRMAEGDKKRASRDSGEREQPNNQGKPGETTFERTQTLNNEFPKSGTPNPNPVDRQGQAVNMPDHRRSNPNPAAPPSLSQPTNPPTPPKK